MWVAQTAAHVYYAIYGAKTAYFDVFAKTYNVMYKVIVSKRQIGVSDNAQWERPSYLSGYLSINSIGVFHMH